MFSRRCAQSGPGDRVGLSGCQRVRRRVLQVDRGSASNRSFPSGTGIARLREGRETDAGGKPKEKTPPCGVSAGTASRSGVAARLVAHREASIEVETKRGSLAVASPSALHSAQKRLSPRTSSSSRS